MSAARRVVSSASLGMICTPRKVGGLDPAEPTHEPLSAPSFRLLTERIRA